MKITNMTIKLINKKGEKMKKKILKIIIGVLISILIIFLAVISYFMITNTQTKEPEDILQKYNLEVEEYIGRKVFVVTPKEREKTSTVILYFHGGSYMAEATDRHWEFIEKLINDTGATVIFPDYPLTPKYNYKDVFNMVTPLYKEIEDRIDVANQLIVMGDSAGGGLSLALLEKISEENLPMTKKTILISPWLDVRLNNPEIEKVQEKDPQLNKDALKLAGIAYAGEDGINSYLVNPIDGDISKLKNVTIFIGTYDILNPDVHELAKRAEQQNINIEIKEYEEAKHIWIIDRNSDEQLVNQAYQDLLSTVNE